MRIHAKNKNKLFQVENLLPRESITWRKGSNHSASTTAFQHLSPLVQIPVRQSLFKFNRRAALVCEWRSACDLPGCVPYKFVKKTTQDVSGLGVGNTCLTHADLDTLIPLFPKSGWGTVVVSLNQGDRQTDRQTYRQAGRQASRQADR